MNLDDQFKAKELSETARNHLLDELDSDDAAYINATRRGGTRFPYRKYGVRCHIEHPGGGVSDVEVITRNLSRTGLSFLHSNFLYNGSQLVIWLQRRLGGLEEVRGTVMSCKHVVARHHLVGIRFTQDIFPQLFVDAEHKAAEEQMEEVDASLLKGRILLIEDQETDQALFRFYLRQAKNLDIEMTADVSKIESILSGENAKKFDLVCTDLNLEGGTGEDVIAICRLAGYKGPIICITAEETPKRLALATAAGAVAIIRKPYDIQNLLAVLGEHLGLRVSNPKQEIISLKAGIPEMGILIDFFVANAHMYAGQLRALSKTEESDAVKLIAMSLMGSGTSIGFPMVTDAARDVLKSITSTLSVALSASEIERLIIICTRLSSRKQAEAA